MAIQNNTPFVRHVGGTEGTTGWSRTDVLNAIEQVLADAGIHGSSPRKGGVAVNCLAPGSTQPFNGSGWNSSYWNDCGGPGIRTNMPALSYRNIRVTSNGNSNYILTPIWHPHIIYTNGEIYMDKFGGGNPDFATNTSNNIPLENISGLHRDGYQTGDSFILRNASGDPANIPPELTVGNTYYMIVPATYNDIANGTYPDTFKIAETLADANNGVAMTFANQWSGTTMTADQDPNLWSIEFEFPAITKLTVRQDDYITFHLTGLTGHPTTIVDTDDTALTFPGGTYDDSRELLMTTNTVLKNFQIVGYKSAITGLGLETGRIVWHTRGWAQGDYVLQCKNHSAMQNVIEVLPSVATYENGYNQPYWDYTVPASGSRQQCTFRVFRETMEVNPSSDRGKVKSVRIQTPDSTGWTTNEVFTIPGDQIGGVSPENDIVFGVNSHTAQQIADINAVPSIQVMDVGSGSTNFWAKYVQNNTAFIEIDNDVNKTYGKTFYGIRLKSDNNYQLQLGAGVKWNYLNWNPTSSSAGSEGCWGGVDGFDVVDNTWNFNWDESWYAVYDYGVGSNANTYPMKVQVWKANTNDPQDPNFYILQFVQNVAGSDESQLSLYFHKGTVIGNGIWDLDHVWQGGITAFIPTTYNSFEEVIHFETHMPRNYRSIQENLGNNHCLRRCAEYGYMRDGDETYTANNSVHTYYGNNLYTDNTQNSAVIKPYFRDSAVDKDEVRDYKGDNPSVNIAYGGGITGKATGGSHDYIGSIDYYTGNKSDIASVTQMPSAANYYKPIKGLPLQSGWAPVPYYLPDDFVVIPFNVTPGATTFHTGDSIEVSASEIYKIVEVAYSVNRTTYDGISSNSCKGIAFCARTT